MGPFWKKLFLNTPKKSCFFSADSSERVPQVYKFLHNYGFFGPFWTAHGMFGRHSVTSTLASSISIFFGWGWSNAHLVNAASLQKWWVQLCFIYWRWRNYHCQTKAYTYPVTSPHFFRLWEIQWFIIHPIIENAGSHAIGNSQAYTTAQAQDFIICCACSKPNVIYSHCIIQASKTYLET